MVEEVVPAGLLVIIVAGLLMFIGIGILLSIGSKGTDELKDVTYYPNSGDTPLDLREQWGASYKKAQASNTAPRPMCLPSRNCLTSGTSGYTYDTPVVTPAKREARRVVADVDKFLQEEARMRKAKK